MPYRRILRSSVVALILLFSSGISYSQPESDLTQIYPTKGFCHIAGISTLTGITTQNFISSTVGFSFSNLYKFNQHYSAGAGFGFDFYGLDQSVAVVTPFYAEVRMDILGAREISPFVAVRGGYATAVASEQIGTRHRGGAMFDASAGMRVYLKANRALNFGLGYRLQNVQEEHTSQFDILEQIKTNFVFNRFQARVSFQFH